MANLIDLHTFKNNMTDNSSVRAKSNSIVKIILIAALVYMAYLLSCYVENGRYSATSNEHGVTITDTRTGEALVYWSAYDEGFEDFQPYKHVTVLDHQSQIQINNSENFEKD